MGGEVNDPHNLGIFPRCDLPDHLNAIRSGAEGIIDVEGDEEMSLSENLFLILAAVVMILPIWWIISAYNKRVKQIEELREEVEKLKRKDQRRE